MNVVVQFLQSVEIVLDVHDGQNGVGVLVLGVVAELVTQDDNGVGFLQGTSRKVDVNIGAFYVPQLCVVLRVGHQ